MDIPVEQRHLTIGLHGASLGLWAMVIAHVAFGIWSRVEYTVLFIGAALVLFAYSEVADPDADNTRIDYILLSLVAVITIGTTAYIYVYFEVLFFDRLGYLVWHEYIIATAFLATIIYCSYRAFEMIFVGVIAGAIAYGYLGPYIPGWFGHSGLSTERMLGILIMEVQGVFGSISQDVAVWVALFLLYAGLLRGYGAFDLILRAAFQSAKYIRSGVSQSSVIASMLIGSITGAQTANVALTGSITIPTMKESGIRSETAGGIEAVASSGGQIMPPVMGAAAFVMASLLGIQYVDILIAGLFPALVFFITVVIGVHYTTIGQLSSTPTLQIDELVGEKPDKIKLVADALKFLGPFILLLYLLGVAQWTVMSSALYTCLAMFIAGITVPLAEQLYRGHTDLSDLTVTMSRRFRETIDGSTYGAKALVPIVIIIAVVNGIVDILMATGVPGTFSLALLNLSGGSLLLAAILAMGVCIVLGLGMPTVAAYTIVALLVAPGLVNQFQVPELAAHFFVFYAAILSGITPPIAIAVVIATGIAGSDFLETCIEAIKIAAVLFILPFVFIYNPELVTGGVTIMTLVITVFTLVGGFSVVHGLNYVYPVNNTHIIDLGVRGVYVALGVVVMILPMMAGKIVGTIAILGMVMSQRTFGASPTISAAETEQSKG